MSLMIRSLLIQTRRLFRSTIESLMKDLRPPFSTSSISPDLEASRIRRSSLSKGNGCSSTCFTCAKATSAHHGTSNERRDLQKLWGRLSESTLNARLARNKLSTEFVGSISNTRKRSSVDNDESRSVWFDELDSDTTSFSRWNLNEKPGFEVFDASEINGCKLTAFWGSMTVHFSPG